MCRSIITVKRSKRLPTVFGYLIEVDENIENHKSQKWRVTSKRIGPFPEQKTARQHYYGRVQHGPYHRGHHSECT